MKVSTRTSGDVTIIAPSGKITIGVGDVALREAVAQLITIFELYDDEAEAVASFD